MTNDNVAPPEKPALSRNVKVLLYILIGIAPYLFAWITLRQDFTRKVRVYSFAWLACFVIALMARTDDQQAGQVASNGMPANPVDSNGNCVVGAFGPRVAFNAAGQGTLKWEYPGYAPNLGEVVQALAEETYSVANACPVSKRLELVIEVDDLVDNYGAPVPAKTASVFVDLEEVRKYRSESRYVSDDIVKIGFALQIKNSRVGRFIKP